MIETRRWCRRAALVGLAMALVAAPARAEETTEQQLRELQELRREVELKREQLRRELQMLQGVLSAQEAAPGAAAGLAGMSQEELAAELRILREEVERLRDAVARERLTAEESRFDVTGSVRTRLEWSDVDFVAGAADVVELLRTRVLVTGRPRHDTRVVVEVQDGRRWGDETGPGGDPTLDASADTLDVHQAYVELQEVYGESLRLRLGRQELNYGSYRLMGPAAWGNTGRAYDGLVLRLGETSWVDLFVAKLAEKGQLDRNLFGLQGEVRLDGDHWAGPYALLEHDKAGGAGRLRRATAGNRFHGTVTGRTGHVFGYDLEGAAQAGEVGGADVRAWMAAGTVRYRAPASTQPEVRLGADYMSGDPDPARGNQEAFDNLFASRHMLFGYMDLFRDFPEDTGQAGLVDVHLVGEMSATQTARVGIHVHHFALAEGSTKTMGQEADAVVDYDYSESAALQWGGSIFVPGDAMKARRGEDPAFKTWLQLVGKF